MPREGGALRVHISPVGFEVRRVVEPLIRLRADRAYLVTGRPDDLAKKQWRAIHEALSEEYKAIEVKDEYENPWDFHALLRLYGRITRSERADGNEVLINVSTGTKVSAMVGLLAGMFWGASPYYAETGYVGTSETVGNIVFPPLLRFSVMPPQQREVLHILKAEARSLRKEEMIQSLRRAEILPESGQISEASVYRRLEALLGPLVDQRFIIVKGNRKAGRIELTEEGRAAALLLEPAPT